MLKVKRNQVSLVFRDILGLSDPETIELLETSCFVTKKQKGEILFRQDQRGSIIYYLLDGKVKLYLLDQKGNECVIRFVNKNEFFAEILLTQDTYPVNAQLLCDSTMLGIDKNKLLPLLKSHPELSVKIIYMFANRINYLVDSIERLSTKSAKEKFLNYLIYLSKIHKSQTIVLGIPKQELALLLGMTKETFSRIEKQLITDGVIAVKNKEIKLLKKILP